MSDNPKIYIVSLEEMKKRRFSFYWGQFNFEDTLWRLTSEPEKLFENDSITILRCFAHEHMQDEQGVALMTRPDWDPCRRHFLVCLKADGTVFWWHNLGDPCFDMVKRRLFEDSITIQGRDIVVKGYDFDGKTIYFDIETGTVRKI